MIGGPYTIGKHLPTLPALPAAPAAAPAGRRENQRHRARFYPGRARERFRAPRADRLGSTLFHPPEQRSSSAGKKYTHWSIAGMEVGRESERAREPRRTWVIPDAGTRQNSRVRAVSHCAQPRETTPPRLLLVLRRSRAPVVARAVFPPGGAFCKLSWPGRPA